MVNRARCKRKRPASQQPARVPTIISCLAVITCSAEVCSWNGAKVRTSRFPIFLTSRDASWYACSFCGDAGRLLLADNHRAYRSTRSCLRRSTKTGVAQEAIAGIVVGVITGTSINVVVGTWNCRMPLGVFTGSVLGPFCCTCCCLEDTDICGFLTFFDIVKLSSLRL